MNKPHTFIAERRETICQVSERYCNGAVLYLFDTKGNRKFVGFTKKDWVVVRKRINKAFSESKGCVICPVLNNDITYLQGNVAWLFDASTNSICIEGFDIDKKDWLLIKKYLNHYL